MKKFKEIERINYILGALIVLAVGLSIYALIVLLRVDADIISAKNSVADLASCGSYSFSSTAIVDVQDQQREYYCLDGDIVGNNCHIKGNVLETPVEIYYAEGIFWQKNGTDGTFKRIAVEQLAQALAFAAELSPYAMLQFGDDVEFTYLGKDKLADETCRLVSIKTTSADGWIGEYFTEVEYKLWLALREDSIRSAEISARSLRNDIGLTVSIDLYNQGKNIIIKAPQE